jgi:hypothetical protein
MLTIFFNCQRKAYGNGTNMFGKKDVHETEI